MTSRTITADPTNSELPRVTSRRDSSSLQRPPFGMSRRVWTFAKALVAAAVASFAIYATTQLALDWQPAEWGVADKLALVVKAAAVAILPALAAIAVVAAQRLNPEHFVGEKVKRNSALDINIRFIQNTIEQFVVYFVANAALALYALSIHAKLVPVFAVTFLVARVLYWWGYHYNSYVRSFGFGVTFFPTVGIYAWLALHMTTGLYITL